MNPPLVLTRDESRRVDKLAIDEYGIPGMVLMENAGRGVVDVLLQVDPGLRNVGQSQRSVVILCGKGNNAGDGFVIARHLEIRGVAAKALLLGPPGELAGDARQNYDILIRTGFPVVDLAAASVDLANAGGESLVSLLDAHAAGAAWLVDALLGTGARGEPREPFAAAIAWMNRQPARRLAVDIPSGLDCDSGQASATTVRADVTCTFLAAKPGLLATSAREFVGDLHVASIGIAARLFNLARTS